MTQQIINVGAVANDGTGESLRSAFQAVNDNFSNVWAQGPVDSQVVISNNVIGTNVSNQNLVIQANGIGVITVSSSVVPGIDSVWDLGAANAQYDSVYARYYYGDASNMTGLPQPTNLGAVNTDILPVATQAFNIGSQTQQWQKVYTGGIVAGNASVITINVGNLHIPGGTNGYVLQTDGAGNLSWTAQTGGGGNGTPGGANTQIQFNDAGAFGGQADFTFNKTSNVMTVPGNIVPNANAAQSLGNVSHQWKDLWVSNNTIYINSVPLTLSAGNVLSIGGNPLVTVNANSVANIGNFVFNGNKLENTNGSSFDNGGLVNGATALLSLPANGNTGPVAVYNSYGNIVLQAGANSDITAQWSFNNNGTLSTQGNITANSVSLSGQLIFANGSGAVGEVGYGFSGPAINAYTGKSVTIRSNDQAYSWRFGTAGNLTLPDGSVIQSGVLYGNGSAALGNATGDNKVYAQDSGVGVQTNNGNITNTWFYDRNGNLTLPGNTFAVNYANGTQVALGGGSGANTGNITFDNINIIGDGNIHLQPDPEDTSAYVNIYLTTGPDIHIAGNGENLILGTDDFANVTVGVDGNVYVQASTGTPHTWTFDATGDLTLPNGTRIGTPEGTGTTGVVAPIDTEFLIETSQLPTDPPTIIAISGADFSPVNLTYTRDSGQPTPTWIPAGYNPGSDPYITFDTEWGINVPGFEQALYINTGTINVPLEQWNINPPLGSVPPTGAYTYPNGYVRTWSFGSNGTLVIAGDIETQEAGFPFTSAITNITTGNPTVIVDIADNIFPAPVIGQVTIVGVIGTTEANDFYYYRAVESNQFQLFQDAACTLAVDGTSWTAYAGGGTAYAPAYDSMAISTGGLQVVAGPSSWYFGVDGNLNLAGGITSNGTIDIDNRASGNSADIRLYAADDITLQARDRTLGSGSEGGDINIYAGDSAEDSDSSGGDVTIEAGNGGAANVDFGGNGGFITIQSGRGGDASTGVGNYPAEQGGALNLRAGDAGSNMGNIARGADGGDVYIEAGDSTGNGLVGGSIFLVTGLAGPNAQAGDLQIQVPSSDSGPGGTWYFNATGNLSAPGAVIGANLIANSNFVGTRLATNLTDFNWSDPIVGITLGANTYVILDNNVFGDPWQGQVTIQGVLGATEANGDWYYLAVDSNQFELFSDANATPVDSTSWDPYTSGGLAFTTGYANLEINGQNITIRSDHGDYNNKIWSFNSNGSTIFPQLSVQRGDNPSGTISGYTLNGSDGSQEFIITTPDGSDAYGTDSQRIVINPGAGAANSGGEGGDIYLWAGRGGDGSGSGGDIKIRGGQGGANTTGGSGGAGGYIRIEAGDANAVGGAAGYIDITGGFSNVAGGYVHIQGGGGNARGGDANITGGYGYGGGGGNVNIIGGSSALGAESYGNVIINTGNTGNTWTFDRNGILTVPGEGVIRSNNDTIKLQSWDTANSVGYGLRIGTTGGLYLEQGSDPAWLTFNPNAGNAEISAAGGTSGSAGHSISIAAGAADQTDYFTTPGGNVNITGGLGASNDGGGGGPGGSVNLTSGASADPAGHNGNVTINTGGANTWTFDYTGNVSVPGTIVTASGSGGNISGANVITANTFVGSLSYLANSAGRFTLLSDNTLLSGTVASPQNFKVNDSYTPDIDLRNASGTGTFTQGSTSYTIRVAGTNNLTLDNTGLLSAPGVVSAVGNITGANLIATANVLGNGYAKFAGTFDESIGANTGVVMGYAGGTPRILFGTGNTQQTFEIDNDSGTLRFYQPGSTKASLSADGVFTANVAVTTPKALSSLTAVAGARAFVNNGNLTAAGNFGAQIGGGGSNIVPVWSDGVNWYIG